jgi:hypothetical protein
MTDETIEDSVNRSGELEKGYFAALLAPVSASGPADAAVVFAQQGDAARDPVAVYPTSTDLKLPSSWLKQAAALRSDTIDGNGPKIIPFSDPNALYDAPTNRHLHGPCPTAQASIQLLISQTTSS